MSPQTTPCTRHLEPTQISMLSEGAPALLTVTDGTLWLTRGDGEAIVLAVGECARGDAGDMPDAGPLGSPGTTAMAATERHALARAV